MIEERYKIVINKYFKDDLILYNSGVVLVGNDSRSCELRLPALNGIKRYLSSKLIAECNNYIYIPKDLIPEDDMIYKFPKPIETKDWQKYNWKTFKTKYSYRGSRLWN